MNINRFIVILILLTMGFAGCETYKTLHICVKDEQNRQPLEGVTGLVLQIRL